MGQGRRQFTDEFKREAVALLASSGRPLLQIASELGISPSMLRNWRNRNEGRNTGWRGAGPRLSGSVGFPLEGQLSWIERGWRYGFEEAVEASAVHQIGADEAGEGERARDRLLCRLGDAQQQEGDQGDGDLDPHGVFAGAEKVADFEGLLDPAEEQLDIGR